MSARSALVAAALLVCAPVLAACGGGKTDRQARVKSAKDVRPDEGTSIIAVGQVPAKVAEVTDRVWTLSSRARHRFYSTSLAGVAAAI